MPDLNVDLDYFEHLKTRRLASKLGPFAPLIPIKLWAYCGKYHPEDGRFSQEQDKEIADIAGFSGDATSMLQALLDAGFIDRDVSGVFFIHDWMDHQGHLVAYKQRAKIAAKARWSKLSPKNATSIATSIPSSNAKSSLSNAVSNAPTVPTDCTDSTNGTDVSTGSFEKTLLPDFHSTPDKCMFLYQIYPKKVERAAALKAIEKAIKKHGMAFLQTKVSQYRDTCNFEPEYMPNPASWFNGERFHDDPTTWVKGKKAQTTIDRNAGNANEGVVFKPGPNVTRV